MSVSKSSDDVANRRPDTDTAFRAILAAAELARQAQPPAPRQAYAFLDGALRPVADASGVIVWSEARRWMCGPAAPAEWHALLDLYLPVCSASAESPITTGHLGQSLDGNVATASGDSYYVTGPGNLLHLHRMRALCDAVIVGAGTVVADDPRLTTRKAPGDNPVRIVLDPKRRLPLERNVFQDHAAPTLLVCDPAHASPDAQTFGAAELLGVPTRHGRFDLRALLETLYDRGLYALFVEGGGRTVSAFLEADTLDRLQIAVAPLVTGSGRPGLTLDARQRIADCLRPAHRIFMMGEDVMFDCDLRGVREAPIDSASLSRVY